MPAAWCDVHHFVHWIHGGATSVANGVLLCGRHHRFLHAHPDWITTFDDQILRVYRPDGRELRRHPWAEEHDTDPPERLPGHGIRPEPMLV